MSRKKRINHHGNGGGYLSEAVDGPSIPERKQQRSHTQGKHTPVNNNKTLNNTTTYVPIQASQKHAGEDKLRGGSLSYANHKYNQSSSGIKRGSTAPGGA